MAFLINVFREVIAIICIPFVAKHLGGIASLALGGATTMDITIQLFLKELRNILFQLFFYWSNSFYSSPFFSKLFHKA
ncbi:hypothetical protein CDO51_02055 [Natranaerobius trueperi]|uniref:Uncharacterized protein n=1 Tax=Natranaerobius trueperi TaxID=759412 RepID=A0A226C009_9FIRM|nr:hypothetical protein CDO51_02055 [Natranaerobius trueperi]